MDWRTTEPTTAEVQAHAAAYPALPATGIGGGYWMVRRTWEDTARGVQRLIEWRPIDGDGMPVPWPAPAEIPFIIIHPSQVDDLDTLARDPEALGAGWKGEAMIALPFDPSAVQRVVEGDDCAEAPGDE